MGNYALKKVALRYTVPTKGYGLKLSLCLYEATYKHSESGDWLYEHRWDLEPSKETMATAEELYHLGFDKFDSATISKPLNVQSSKEDYTFILESLKENYFDENVVKAYNLLPYELRRIFEKEVLHFGNTISKVSSGYDENSGKGLKITFCDKLHFSPTAPMIKGGRLQEKVYRLNDIELGSIMGLQESPEEKFYPYVGQYLHCDYAMGVDEWMQTRKLPEPWVECEYCIGVDDVIDEANTQDNKDIKSLAQQAFNDYLTDMVRQMREQNYKLPDMIEPTFCGFDYLDEPTFCNAPLLKFLDEVGITYEKEEDIYLEFEFSNILGDNTHKLEIGDGKDELKFISVTLYPHKSEKNFWSIKTRYALYGNRHDEYRLFDSHLSHGETEEEGLHIERIAELGKKDIIEGVSNIYDLPKTLKKIGAYYNTTFYPVIIDYTMAKGMSGIENLQRWLIDKNRKRRRNELFQITFDDRCIFIDDKKYAFPLSADELAQSLGKYNVLEMETIENGKIINNTYYDFDQAGIIFRSKSTDLDFLKQRNLYIDDEHDILSLAVFSGICKNNNPLREIYPIGRFSCDMDIFIIQNEKRLLPASALDNAKISKVGGNLIFTNYTNEGNELYTEQGKFTGAFVVEYNMNWEWEKGSVLYSKSPYISPKEIFQAVCYEIGRYYAPMGAKYTHSRPAIKWKTEKLKCQISFWSSGSNIQGDYVALEILGGACAISNKNMEGNGGVYLPIVPPEVPEGLDKILIIRLDGTIEEREPSRDSDGSVEEGRIILSNKCNLQGIDMKLFYGIIKYIDAIIERWKILESKESIDAYLTSCPKEVSDEFLNDHNNKIYYDSL